MQCTHYFLIGQQPVNHQAFCNRLHSIGSTSNKYNALIGYCICQSQEAPAPRAVMSHSVTPFLLGSSCVQKGRIRSAAGTSNGTSLNQLVDLSVKQDTCLYITTRQCRQKTSTRTHKWTTKMKNR